MPRKTAFIPIDQRILVHLVDRRRLSLRRIARALREPEPTVRSALLKLQKAALIQTEEETFHGPGYASRKLFYSLQPRARELLDRKDWNQQQIGLEIISKALELGDTRPISQVSFSLMIRLLREDPFFTKKRFPIDPRGQLALSLRFVARVLTAISKGHVIGPPTPERLKALREQVIGEGPWMIEYEPNKTRPATREEVEAMLSGKRFSWNRSSD